jgi:hypothetical protein
VRRICRFEHGEEDVGDEVFLAVVVVSGRHRGTGLLKECSFAVPERRHGLMTDGGALLRSGVCVGCVLLPACCLKVDDSVPCDRIVAVELEGTPVEDLRSLSVPSIDQDDASRV